MEPDGAVMEPVLVVAALAAKGFMPPDEGTALFEIGCDAAATGLGPLLEVGAYCGKSSIYLGAAARARGVVLYSVDHHRGSEENQAGWEHHDPDLVDERTGRMDTLPHWRRTIEGAGLEDVVIGVVGDSRVVAANWKTPLSFLFIDGGHGEEPAWADYRGWSPFVAKGGILAIHDVFPDPEDGGRPPFEIYSHALASGDYTERRVTGSLRALEKVD